MATALSKVFLDDLAADIGLKRSTLDIPAEHDASTSDTPHDEIDNH